MLDVGKSYGAGSRAFDVRRLGERLPLAVRSALFGAGDRMSPESGALRSGMGLSCSEGVRRPWLAIRVGDERLGLTGVMCGMSSESDPVAASAALVTGKVPASSISPSEGSSSIDDKLMFLD